MGHHMKATTAVIFLLILISFACKESSSSVSGTGTIVHFTLEGGFYGIVADKGDHFLPENLTIPFQQDSIRIHFQGVITDRMTTQQWGRTITLTQIERIQ